MHGTERRNGAFGQIEIREKRDYYWVDWDIRKLKIDDIH
jgi:hypothetical protein